MLRFWHIQKHKQTAIYTRPLATSFRKLLSRLEQAPGDATKNTASQQAAMPKVEKTPQRQEEEPPKAKIEDGKWIPKGAPTSLQQSSSMMKDMIKASFQRANEQQRKVVHNRWTQQDYGTNYQNRPKDGQRTNSAQSGGGGRQQPQLNKSEQMYKKSQQKKRRTAEEYVQRGRTSASSGASTNAVPEEDIVVDPEDMPEAQPTSEGESRYLQKQIDLERKRKELDALLPTHNLQEAYRKQGQRTPRPPPPPSFPVSDGPLSVADLKRIAAERLQHSSEHMPANTFVDYKAINKAKRHNRMNMLKAKNAARRERMYGKKKAVTVINEIKIPHNGLTVREVAQRLSMKIDEVIERFEALGEIIPEDMEDLLLDPDMVELLALELNLDVVRQEAIYRDATQYIKASTRAGTIKDSELSPRMPVVSVMGHVDHGKTTLLDYLRKGSVAGQEAGGITQRLSAFNIQIGGRGAVFLDTPGHAAFSSMRKKGSAAADIAVIVVAVDDGVRPQTVEAIRMAKKGECSIIVVLNKIDKIAEKSDREAARRRVLTQLMEYDVTAEEFGGDVQVVEASAKTGEGVDSLIDTLLLQADIMELKGYNKGPAEGVVLDAKMEKGRGVVVDVLIKWGLLSVGDPVVVNTSFGKVRSLMDETGKSIKTAGPSTPVRIMGLKAVPAAGQELLGTADESKARKIAERRQKLEDTKRINDINRRAKELEDDGNPIIIRVILKADSIGALNALRSIVDGLAERADGVSVHVIGSSVGEVNPSDISLAAMSAEEDGERATILGFNINEPTGNVRTQMKQHDVTVVRNDVVYRLEEALEGIMHEHMPEERHLVVEGVARVLQLFDYKAKNMVKVAGLEVLSGTLKTSKKYVFRVKRELANVHVPEDAEPPETDEEGYVTILEESGEAHLKRFKDVVNEVKNGLECGFSIDDYSDFMPGDKIECCKVENKFKSLIVHRYSQELKYGASQKEPEDNSDDEEDTTL